MRDISPHRVKAINLSPRHTRTLSFSLARIIETSKPEIIVHHPPARARGMAVLDTQYAMPNRVFVPFVEHKTILSLYETNTTLGARAV